MTRHHALWDPCWALRRQLCLWADLTGAKWGPIAHKTRPTHRNATIGTYHEIPFYVPDFLVGPTSKAQTNPATNSPHFRRQSCKTWTAAFSHEHLQDITIQNRQKQEIIAFNMVIPKKLTILLCYQFKKNSGDITYETVRPPCRHRSQPLPPDHSCPTASA